MPARPKSLQENAVQHRQMVACGAENSPAPYGHCHWCNRMLLAPERHAKRSLTRDHVYPKSRGGKRTVKSCRHCNHLKGDLLPGQWSKVMAMFPNWWKAFHTHGDLRAAMDRSRRELLAPLRIARIQPRWPRSVSVTPPPLCRGLPSPWFRYGRNV